MSRCRDNFLPTTFHSAQDAPFIKDGTNLPI